MEFPGQGSYLSYSHALICSHGSAGSSTHCVGPGIEPAPQRSQDAANPIAPQQEVLLVFFFVRNLCISRKEGMGEVFGNSVSKKTGNYVEGQVCSQGGEVHTPQP